MSDVSTEMSDGGPVVSQGRGRRKRVRLVVIGLAVVLLALVGVSATTTQVLVSQAERNLTRVPVPSLETVPEGIDARTFLLLGSDSRAELTEADREALPFGEFGGQRADVVMYVSVSEDREQVSVISFPRDLLVQYEGVNRKLTDTYMAGPDAVVRVLGENFDLPVNHVAAVDLGGFLQVVRTLGTVEICLEEPLRDVRSGADFDAGCHEMDERDALAFVRSRQGARSDLDRIDRQQDYLRAVLSELTAARTLANPPQLYRLAEDVASAMSVDDELRPTDLLGLTDELRGIVGGGVPMTTVPAYPQRLDGRAYMVAYAPGAAALFRDLRAGRPLPDRGTPQDREDTVVLVAASGDARVAGIVESTARWSGFATRSGSVSSITDSFQGRTTVLAVPGEEERAGWVAAVLGAPIGAVPDERSVPDGVHVVVIAGDDALGDGGAGDQAG